MNQYIDAELRLAKLLGHEHPVKDENTEIIYVSAGPHDPHMAVALPRWTRDNGACMELVIEHQIDVKFTYGPKDAVNIETEDLYGTKRCIPVSAHESKEVAVRYAVVTAIIAELDHRAHIIRTQDHAQQEP